MSEKKNAAIKATEFIEDNMILGLGTGSTAAYMIERVGQLVDHGLKIRTVATSQSSADLANKFKIPLVTLDEVEKIDLVIDGVDEIDGQFNAIKGGGGALFREKMIAQIADKVIWIMDSSKKVDMLGEFPLPVEILPFGYSHILKKLEELFLSPVLRMNQNIPFVTDNHNFIVDLHLQKGFNIQPVFKKIKSVSGVLETGLFLNMCNRIIVGTNEEVQVIENPNNPK